MPSWMLGRFADWDDSYQNWRFVESRAILLDINGTALSVTDLETMRQLTTHTLSMDGYQCKIKGLWMAIQYKASPQSAVSITSCFI